MNTRKIITNIETLAALESADKNQDFKEITLNELRRQFQQQRKNARFINKYIKICKTSEVN